MKDYPLKEFIQKQAEQYRKHLEAGGEPVWIKLELHTWEEGLQWTVQGSVPEAMHGNMMVVQFTAFAREQIQEALKPPSEKGKDKPWIRN